MVHALDIYRAAIRPILFSGLNTDPEWLHEQVILLLDWLDRTPEDPFSRWFQSQIQQIYCLTDSRLQQTLWGLSFPNPVGLAAGFDKNGVASGVMSRFGFGFTEVGTVTLHAQPGNPYPRLFRLLADHAVLNRMGFNNHGAAAMADRLQRKWGDRTETMESTGSCLSTSSQRVFPLGINLGKSKVTALDAAAADYLGSFQLLTDWGDYFVVNVSSPNTPGLRSLQATDQLEPILRALQAENQERKPLLVKIAPDLEWSDIAAVLDLAQQCNLSGVIATNTTTRRDGLNTQILSRTGNPIQKEDGGISGAPLRQRSTDVIRFIYKETGGRLPIIGVGGIFTPEDAWEKIIAGASLVQVYTGWIYEGPWMIRRILEGLLTRLDDQGLGAIAEAVGLEYK